MRLSRLLIWCVPLSALAFGLFCWLRDEAPTPQVQSWLAKAQELVQPSRAYLFLLGLDAAPRTSPLALGESRLQAYQRGLAVPVTPAQLPLPQGPAYCLIESAGCFERLLQRREQLPAVLAEQTALLGRYRYFLSLSDFQSSAMPGPDEPRLPLQYLTRAQQVLSLQALQLALQGDGQAALALLLEDQAGIRRHLMLADQLELKLGLVTLLNRNLEWLVQLHRASLLPTDQLTLQPLSTNERSLRRSMRREFASHAVFLGRLREQDVPILLEEASLFFEYKPQSTINASFEHYRFATLLSEMSPAQFQQRMGQHPRPYTGLRNRIGNSLLDLIGSDLIDDVGQVQDLDGKIRLVSLSMSLTPGVVDQTQLAQLAINQGVDNPYVALQPPYLDEQQRLCFQGPLPDRDGGRCVRL